MNKLKSEELILIEGGSTNWLSATFLNAIARGLGTILEIGRSIGTSISRIMNHTTCS